MALVQDVGELTGLDFERVLSSPRVAVVPVESPLADAETLTVDELVDYPWLGVAGQEPGLVLVGGFRPRPRCARGASSRGDPHRRRHDRTPVPARRGGGDVLPHPDVRFIPVYGPPVQVAVAPAP